MKYGVNVYFELTRTRRDMLLAVAQLDAEGETPTGADVSERVQELRAGDRPANQTVYDGLQRLRNLGLVDRRKVNERTHAYHMTDTGWSILDAVRDEYPKQD